MPVTVDVSSYNESADGKLYGRYPAGDAPVGTLEITSISGTWGGVLTISGNNFGSTGPTILAADSFVGKTNGQVVGLNDPQIGTYAQLSNGSKYDTSVGLGGNAGMLYIDEVNGWDTGHAPVLGSPGASDAIRQAAGISVEDWQGWFPFRDFVFYCARYANIGNFNAKDSWMMLGNRGDNPQDPGEGNDLVLNNDTGASINVFSNQQTFNPTYSPVNSGRFAANEWNYHLYQNKQNNPVDQPTDFYMRGHVVSDRIGEDYVTNRVMYQDTPAQPPWFDRIKLNGFSSPSTGAVRHFGAVYFAISDELSGSDTFANCRVEFFDNADPDSAPVYGILPTTSWSANELVTLPDWDMGVDQNDVYIRVVDKDDNKSPLFKLT